MRQWKGLSASCLKSLARSPEHCYENHLKTKVREPRDSSDAMMLGTLVHMMQLERKLPIDLRYAVMPEGMAKRGKAWEDFKENARCDGKEIVRRPVYEKAVAISKIMDKNILVGSMLNGRRKHVNNEYKIEWFDHAINKVNDSPVWFNGFIDHCNHELHRIVDIKTTANADNISKVAADGRWDIQAAQYVSGMETVHGGKWEMYFLVVETSSPFRVRAVTLGAVASANGRSSRAKLTNEFMSRLEREDWTGGSEAEKIELPTWFNRSLEEENEQ